MDDLGAACEAAVAESRPVALRLRERLDAVIATFDLGTEPARHASIDDWSAESREILEVARHATRDAITEVRRALDQRIAAIDTFNVVLFGRTGTGKSSLIEALSRGQGTRISKFGSDHTTEAETVQWGSLQLVDTPGIQGWGRTDTRENLEERARRAAISADIVVLCFDSKNQLAADFDRVAAWVSNYGKPVIGVLNVLNPRWRFPAKVDTREGRVNCSTQVVEHLGHIRQELTRTGLDNPPIVCLQTQRAVHARATEPYEAHDQSALRSHRSIYGVEKLDVWSNLPLLERLISDAIHTDALHLRMGSMLLELRGALGQAGAQLEDLAAAAIQHAQTLETAIERVLAILGTPETFETVAEAQSTEAVDLAPLAAAIRDLEVRRGTRFEAPGKGAAEARLESLITEHLSALRAQAHSRATTLITDAFAQRKEVGGERFLEQVVDQAEVRRRLELIEADLGEYLTQRLSIVLADAKADLAAPIDGARRFAIDGKAGMRSSRTTVGLKIATPLLGIVGVVLASNPFGWVLIGLSAIAGFIAPRESRRYRLQRELAEAQARGNATTLINTVFDEWRARLITAYVFQSRAALQSSLGALIDQVSTLRLIADAAEQRRGLLTALLDDVGLPAPPARVLAAARSRLEHQADTGDALWTGNDWIDDPEGLRAEDRWWSRLPRPRRRRAEELPPWQGPTLAVLQALADARAGTPAAGTGRGWLRTVEDQLAHDAGSKDVLTHLSSLAKERKQPRVVFCGDYSAGKTSMIRRLFIESRRQPPESLKVNAAPETDRVQVYPWESYLLVDTPGLQASGTDRSQQQRSAIEEAALVVWVFGPGLIVGDRTALDAALTGDGYATPPLDRMIFVINRIEELGADPAHAGEDFVRLCQRRRTELVQALNRALPPGHPGVRPERIFFLAGDPYGIGLDGLVDDWSKASFAELIQTFKTIHRTLASTSADAAVLNAGAGRLWRLAQAAGRAESELDQRVAGQARLENAVHDGLRTGTTLAVEAFDTLETTVVSFIQSLLVRAASHEENRQTVAARLVALSTDFQLVSKVQAWNTAMHHRVESWRRSTYATIERRLPPRSSAVPVNLADLGGLPADFLAPRRGDVLRDTAHVAGSVGRMAARAASVGGRAARAVPVVNVAVAAVDIASLVNELVNNPAKADAQRAEYTRRLFELAHLWVIEVIPRSDALTQLSADCDELERALASTTAEHRRLHGELDRVRADIHRYRSLAHDAYNRLSTR